MLVSLQRVKAPLRGLFYTQFYLVAKVTQKDIQSALIGLKGRNLWSPYKVLAIPNCCQLLYEADLLIVQPSDWAWEIEIKTSVADFRREFKTKAQKHKDLRAGFRKGYRNTTHHSYIRRFLFAMPEDVYVKVAKEIPDWAGAIIIRENKRHRPLILNKGVLLPTKKVTPEIRVKLMNSVYQRFWQRGYNE